MSQKLKRNHSVNGREQSPLKTNSTHRQKLLSRLCSFTALCFKSLLLVSIFLVSFCRSWNFPISLEKCVTRHAPALRSYKKKELAWQLGWYDFSKRPARWVMKNAKGKKKCTASDQEQGWWGNEGTSELMRGAVRWAAMHSLASPSSAQFLIT